MASHPYTSSEKHRAGAKSGPAVLTNAAAMADFTPQSPSSRKATSMARDVIDLISCTTGIYSCYLAYGYLQERIYRFGYGPEDEHYNYSLFLVFCQCIVNAAVAFVVNNLYPHPTDATPQKEYAKISLSYMGAMFASNYALNFVNYPTQVLAKCCKLIPVMLMRIVINGKRYKLREYFNVVLITSGLAVFQLMRASKKTGAQSTSLIGLALLFLSLFLDGFTGPNQERIIDRYSPSVHQLMFYMNVWAIGFLFVILLVTGEMFSAIYFVQRFPGIMMQIGGFCLCSAIGQNFILVTVFRFNSLVLTTVTTTRKFFSILGSVMWFGHDLNGYQWGGVGLVFSGLMLNIYHKYESKKAHREPPLHHIPGTVETVGEEVDDDKTK